MLTSNPHDKTVGCAMAAWGGDSCNSSLKTPMSPVIQSNPLLRHGHVRFLFFIKGFMW